jgi:hypothetical protein
MHYRLWCSARFAWQNLLRKRKAAAKCCALDCASRSSIWSGLRRRRVRIRLHGVQYCVPECLEQALHATLRTTHPPAPKKIGSHRIPLGLQLLSRRQVTESQLREALAQQRAAGRGRIGEWLLKMDFASEQQITAALARQWSSPVLQTRAAPLNPALLPQIPKLLLDLFQMVPVSFVAATTTLHIAFANGVDHSVLYAIERMLDCRTGHCVVPPSLLRQSLLALGEGRSSTDFVFERVSSISELVSIVSNYAVRVSAREIRMAICTPYNWVRLECASGQNLNLLLRMPSAPRFCSSAPPLDADPPA